jgi:flagellar motility protein MotE (MotC chaperone)
MIRYIRDLRLIPIALIASTCLLALKCADLVFHGSAFFAGNSVTGYSDVSVIRPLPEATAPPGATLSWAQQMFNFPDGSGSPPVPDAGPNITQRLADRDLPDITGSVTAEPAGGDAKTASNAKAAPVAAAKDGKSAPPAGTIISTDGAALPTGAERAILERLQQRREELDTRGRELDIRESLIQSAEKRMDAKLTEVKEVEDRIKVETQQKDAAENARLKGLVTMYENMKPRDAAKIFDRLETPVLIQVSSQINPRQMSEILAQMSPDIAEHLTVELASKAQQVKQDGPVALPKIQGQSTN